MKSAQPGSTTLAAEVTNITPNGVWMLIRGTDKFLSFEHFPWFSDATVSSIYSVELPSENHLYWPELDIDLSVESIDHPERFPLVSKIAERDDCTGRSTQALGRIRSCNFIP